MKRARKYILSAAVVFMAVVSPFMHASAGEDMHVAARADSGGYAFSANSGIPDLPCEPGSSYTAIPSSHNASVDLTAKDSNKFAYLPSGMKPADGYIYHTYLIIPENLPGSVSLSKLRRLNI